MIPSRFNIMIKDEPNDGEMLIYNTLSKSLFVLEPEYRETLEKLIEGKAIGNDDTYRLNEMAKEGYVAQNKETEIAMIAHWMRSITYRPGPTFRAKVFTTMSCNLACEYCFETHMNRSAKLDEQKAGALINKIKSRVEEFYMNEISLEFYGGEPLLNTEIIKFISERLQRWCKETNRTYVFNMTTNGTLLTRERVETLLPFGLVAAKVTVDGIKEVHDQRRPFRTGHGSSFDAIINNLHDVVELLPITILTVYTRGEEEKIPSFLEELEKRDILYKLSGILPGMEMPYLDSNGKMCGGDSFCALNRDTAISYMNALKILTQWKVPLKLELLSGNNCPSSLEQGWLYFVPDGSIYKCPLVVGKPEYIVDSTDRERPLECYYKDLTRELWQLCLEGDNANCPYVPMCGTGSGCRAVALAEKGDFWGHFCAKGFYDYYIPEAMRLELAMQNENEQ